MTKQQVDGLCYFTASEIEKAGGIIAGINVFLFRALDTLRKTSGKPISLLYNGLNSGQHRSPTHLSGDASDILIDMEPNALLGLILAIGFRGFGVYWNRTVFSYHLDIGETYRFWKAEKGLNNQWEYIPLISVP